VGLALLLFGWPPGVSGAAAHPRLALLSPEEHSRFRAAVEALRTGDWPAAIQEFGVLSRRPSVLSDYARFFLAESLARAGDLSRARQTAESLAHDEPESRLVSRALLRAANLATRSGDEAGAERLLRDFLSMFPRSPAAPRARYLLGLTFEAHGRNTEAAIAFRELWLAAPSTAYAEAAGDQLALLAGRGTALPAPTLEERLERAERLLAEGAPAAARDEAGRLLAENPSPELGFRALTVVAQGLQRVGRYGEAAEALGRALGLAPPPARPLFLLELGWLQHRAGSQELALGTLDRVIQQFSKEREAARALVLEGQIFEEAGRLSEATRVYQRATTEFPDQEAVTTALWRLGWIAYLRGDFGGAAQEFARLVELPAGRAYRLASAYWAGRSRESLGEPEEARRLFRLAVAEAPRSYYGILAARRAFRVETATKPPLPIKLPADPLAPLAAEVRFVKAEALRALGLVDHANAELEELSASAVSDPLKLYGLSAVWEREQEYHRALRILRQYFADLAASGHPGLPRRFWEMLYPMSWRSELREAATRAGLDAHLLAAVVREESSFFPHARSRVGARGLMQIMPDTARPMVLRRGLTFGSAGLLDEPRLNLQLGARILASLLREFGDPRLALAAYNAGSVRVREWWSARRSEDHEAFVEQIPFDETRHFVKRVLVSWEEYRRIYGENR
jgi:soluble lytic murein transglycosylase